MRRSTVTLAGHVMAFAFAATVHASPTGHLTQWTFEAGSSTSNPGALPEATGITGPCTRSSTNCASGTGCYRFNPSAQVCSASKTFTATSTVRAFARFRVSTYPGLFGHDFFSLAEIFYGTGVYVEFNNSNQLQVLSFGSGGAFDYCGPLPTPVAPNTWYGIRLRAKKSDAATVSLDLLDDNGTMLDTITCTNQHAGGGNFAVARVGSTNGFGATADITIDDVDIHTDAAWPGNVRWTPLEPTSNASCGYTQSGCTGSTNEWQCVDENPPSDGDVTYLSTSGTTPCTFNHPTAAAKGIDDPIHGTLLWWNARSTAGAPSMTGVLGTADVGVPQALSTTYANYFRFNPANPPNIAQLDATPFGVRKTTSGSLSVTATRLIVGYEDAPPAPTPMPTPALYTYAHSLANQIPLSGDGFGTAIDTAAGYVIVGAPGKSRVYLYDHASGALLRTLQSPNPSAGDRFGAAVAGEGNNVVVGAPLDDSDGADVGAVYFFDGLTGALLKTFKNPNPTAAGAADGFGAAVAAAANRIVVGAAGEDINGADAGAVYVFEQGDATQPNGVLQTTFVKPTPVNTSDFGSVVSAFGGRILIGDPADSLGAANGGAVFAYAPTSGFFTYSGATPLVLRKATQVANDRFGAAVAGGSYPVGIFAFAERIIVGVPGDDSVGADAGKVYAFNPANGALVRTWTKPAAAAGDQFGAAVTSVRSRHIVIGAPFDDTGSLDTGAAYLFDLQSGLHLFTFINPAPQSGDQFAAVLGGGRHTLVGAPHDSSSAFDSGGAYLFERGLPFCANSEPAALIGAWSAAVAHPAAAVHTILTSESTVLFFQGSDVWFEATPTFIWDIATATVREQVTPASNLFCAGHAPLADGRVLVIGGTAVLTDGIATSFAFDPIAESWAQMDTMEYARWYPTATVLSDGRVLATQGHISGANNANTPEIYNPQTNLWTGMNPVTAARAMPLYPFMFLLPNSKILYAGGPDADGPAGSGLDTLLLDLATESWSSLPDSTIPGGSAAMYLPGQVVKSGGENDMNEISSGTTVIDATQTSPSWRVVDAMDFARSHHNLVLLPGGTTLAVGGASDESEDPSVAIMPAELWDSTSEQWSRVACMPMPRMYHSGAVLLPDGRVLSQGGNDYPSYQIYSPAYLFRGARPTVTSAPAAVTYGETFTVETPEAASIASVVMMRPGAATHAFDQNQRRVPVAFVTTTGGLSVTAPTSDNSAPPGYYMLFLINSAGVPSVAPFVQLDHPQGCG